MPNERLFLVQMAGRPGAGKSSIARGIARAIGAVVLDIDVVKSAILDADVAWKPAGRAAYKVLFALAADVLGQGGSVVIDSGSHYETIPQRGAAVAGEAGATYRFVECVCEDDDEIERRLTSRTRRRSQMPSVGTPAPEPGAQHSDAEPTGRHRWKTYGPEDRLVVDTSQPVDAAVALAMRYVIGG